MQYLTYLHPNLSEERKERKGLGGGKERTCWSWRREEGVKCVLSSRHRSCSVVTSVFTSTCSLSFGRKVLVFERGREGESNFLPQNLILPPPPSPNLVRVKRMQLLKAKGIYLSKEDSIVSV